MNATAVTSTPAVTAAAVNGGATLSQDAAGLQLSCLLAGDLPAQLDACTKAINSGLLSPKLLSSALVMRGTVYLKQMKFPDARFDFEEAKRIDPENPNVDMGLALADRGLRGVEAKGLQQAIGCRDLLDRSDRFAACDAFIAQSAGDPRAQAKAYDARAFAKLAEGDAAGAVDDMEKASELDPLNPEIRDHRARALFMHGDYEAAFPGLEAALDLDPYNENLKTYVATIHYLRGDRDRALAEFRTLASWERLEGLPTARAATIQAETEGGADAFAEIARMTLAPRWLSVLGQYRIGEIPEPEFRDAWALLPVEEGGAACFTEFQVGHKLMLMGDLAAARASLARAVSSCGFAEFEHHAAKKLLAQIPP